MKVRMKERMKERKRNKTCSSNLDIARLNKKATPFSCAVVWWWVQKGLNLQTLPRAKSKPGGVKDAVEGGQQ